MIIIEIAEETQASDISDWWVKAVVEQVAGKSGVYLIVTDKAGNTIRDDRPWQMVNGVS